MSVEEPRSRRVAARTVPANLQFSTPTDALSSPPLPPRSPLRPSTSSSSDMPSNHPPSSFSIFTSPMRSITPDKPLPMPPDSPSTSSLFDDDEHVLPTPTSPLLNSPPPISKRTHALLELLSSERAYASDLALVRELYIPLSVASSSETAQLPPLTPPSSSSSSGRTLSTASSSSSGSSASLPPPMTREASRIIFSNIAELAAFADTFTERLEQALGSVLEHGHGEDHIGKLFLEMIPTLEPLYMAYITRHPAALEHLNSLPVTPSLTHYLERTRALSATFTNAWDLPSLLIKPVQRLLKYSLLLSTIIDETPDRHGDKDNLKLARQKMEEVAHGVNEGRRRREVVKELLAGTSSSPGKRTGDKAKKGVFNLGIPASITLGKMRSLRIDSRKVKEGAEANQEARRVARLGDELKATEAFLHQFAKDALAWVLTVHSQITLLHDWASDFGKVINVIRLHQSEAFDAFFLILDRLEVLSEGLQTAMEKELLTQLTRLDQSASLPLKLLEAMATLEPLHYGLLNVNVAKSRPPQHLLEASQSYVALRGQLSTELPQYNGLLKDGATMCIRQFVRWQISFWSSLHICWSDLWDALKVDGESNAGGEETLTVWWNRFSEVSEIVNGLSMVQPLEKLRARSASIDLGHMTTTSSMPGLNPHDGSASSLTLVASPTHSHTKSRSLHSMDASFRSMARRPSNESVHSRKSTKSARSLGNYPRLSSSSNYVVVDDAEYDYDDAMPQLPRAASMPISSPMALKKSHSYGRMLGPNDTHSSSRSIQSLSTSAPSSKSVMEDDDERGRPSRKPSFKRRVTDSFRPSPSSSSHWRSPSLPSAKSTGRSPAPSPRQAVFWSESSSFNDRRPRSWTSVPPMYACRAVHHCKPPPGVEYRGLPFFILEVGEEFDILDEWGHPSNHPDLPLFVDEGEDCLLLVRDETGAVGWALASFLIPVD